LGHFRLKGKAEECDLFEVLWSTTDVGPGNQQTNSAHQSDPATARLQHLAADGHLLTECAMPSQGITIGSTQADINFPESSGLRPLHARFSLERGQVLVEDVGGKGDIFIRLVATHTLQPGDVIAMGRLLFKFVSKPDLAAAATTLALNLDNVTELLQQTAAELVVISPGRHGHYPLGQEEVTFGRTNGRYTFSDNPLMSRSHARIYYRGEDFFLEDLHTRNGTFVRIRRRALVPLGTPVLIRREIFRVLPFQGDFDTLKDLRDFPTTDGSSD
jgi:hypothetical protein